jgi:putative toxin-antitoxin system antitoxin component (TIGR02293 family)
MAKQTKHPARVNKGKIKGTSPKESYIINPRKEAAVNVLKEAQVPSAAMIEEAQLPYLHKKTSQQSKRIPERKNDYFSIFLFFNQNELSEFNYTTLDKMAIIEEGVSKKTLELFKTSAQLDYDQLADNLHVARATLINKKGDEKFNQDLSDKIVSLIDIYSYGYQVFEDKNKFNEWIFRPNKALGKKPPFDFLGNSFGRQEVKNLIGRIDYGVYS